MISLSFLVFTLRVVGGAKQGMVGAVVRCGLDSGRRRG